MRVVAISCVKNECDIIEAFVRHTTAFVDKLVVLDNGSTDGSLAILKSLQSEGLPLQVVRDPEPGYWQWRRMTRLMTEFEVRRFHADWALPLDADEFLVATEGQPLIPSGVPLDRPLGLLLKTYVPDSQDDSSELNPVRRIRHRLRNEAKDWVKVMVPRVLSSQSGATLTQGNHGFCLSGQPVPHHPAGQAFLAHFPGRSASQLLAKVAIAHFQLTAMQDKRPEWCYHYTPLFELIRQDPQRFAAQFREAVLRYMVTPQEHFVPEVTEDPIPYAGGALRYTLRAEDRSGGIRAVFDYVDDLARHFAELSGDWENLAQERANLIRKTSDLVASRDRELNGVRRALAAAQTSWTSRVGRLAVAPAVWLRRLLGQSAPRKSEFRASP
jgi:hypothetical protein